MTSIKKFRSIHATLAVIILAAAGWACAPEAHAAPPIAAAPLATVPSIDVVRYQGTWHQLALYPNQFQKMCASNTRATYTLRADSRLDVLNQCRDADGKPMQAAGIARAAAGTTLSGTQLSPPQLQVRFAPAWLSWLPFVWGNYWVIQLGQGERYAVIGEASREYLWVLARDTQLSATDWAAIESRLKEQGYDPAKLVREKHLP